MRNMLISVTLLAGCVSQSFPDGSSSDGDFSGSATIADGNSRDNNNDTCTTVGYSTSGQATIDGDDRYSSAGRASQTMTVEVGSAINITAGLHSCALEQCRNGAETGLCRDIPSTVTITESAPTGTPVVVPNDDGVAQITPQALGSFSIDVHVDGAPAPFDQVTTVNVIKLVDFDLQCTLDDAHSPCGATVPANTMFSIGITGVASDGQLVAPGIDPALLMTLTGDPDFIFDCQFTNPNEPTLLVCDYLSGTSGRPIVLTVSHDKVTRTLTIPIE